MNSSTPTDEQLLPAITELRKRHPELGRAKFLALLKEQHSWILSENRLKNYLDQHSLNSKPANQITTSNITQTTQLPRDFNFQQVVKAAFLDFKKRERDFFLALSPNKLSKICPGAPDPMFAACHLRQHIEFLLVLKGVKPSFLITHYTHPEIFTEMVEKCLKPVMQAHALERYGFQLHLIDHPTPTTAHKGFQHGWILVDTLSPQYSEVKKVFITPYSGKMDELVVGVALGYPTSDGGREFRAVDNTEMDELAVLRKDEVCCVTAYEFFYGPEPASFLTLMQYSERCAIACEEVGTLIKLDASGHPELQELLASYQ